MIQPYHLLSFHLISRLPDMVQCYYRFGTTQNKHITSSLQHKTMKKDAIDATQHHYFHHQYIKSISLAVLALFTFWWWYHSFWLGGFLVDANNIQHQLQFPYSYHQRLPQKTEALKTRCKTSESVISAKKKVTYLSKARSTSCVISRKYQRREKLMYLDER